MYATNRQLCQTRQKHCSMPPPYGGGGITSCRRAAATVCPRPSPPRWRRSALRRRADGNVAAFSHGLHVLTPTAAVAPDAKHGGEQGGLVTLTYDLSTLKVVCKSRVTWATSVSISVLIGLSVLDLGPMYATDSRQTKASLNARLIRGGGIIIETTMFLAFVCEGQST